MARRHPSSPLFPYTTLFRSAAQQRIGRPDLDHGLRGLGPCDVQLGAIGAGVGHEVLERVLESAAVVDAGELLETPDHEARRSEEHTSELQSLRHLVCRLLLE